MFELQASMPGMGSAEYQTTINPAKISHNYQYIHVIMRMFRQSTNQNHYPGFE